MSFLWHAVSGSHFQRNWSFINRQHFLSMFRKCFRAPWETSLLPTNILACGKLWKNDQAGDNTRQRLLWSIEYRLNTHFKCFFAKHDPHMQNVWQVTSYTCLHCALTTLFPKYSPFIFCPSRQRKWESNIETIFYRFKGPQSLFHICICETKIVSRHVLNVQSLNCSCGTVVGFLVMFCASNLNACSTLFRRHFVDTTLWAP